MLDWKPLTDAAHDDTEILIAILGSGSIHYMSATWDQDQDVWANRDSDWTLSPREAAALAFMPVWIKVEDLGLVDFGPQFVRL